MKHTLLSLPQKIMLPMLTFVYENIVSVLCQTANVGQYRACNSVDSLQIKIHSNFC